ncbi:hypothetical protein OIV83_005036 [Microbotryomycetes sp. JL201]|nr:hypothetical protein OIV83_005036 [Microbotryomycetes sp. JL201]
MSDDRQHAGQRQQTMTRHVAGQDEASNSSSAAQQHQPAAPRDVGAPNTPHQHTVTSSTTLKPSPVQSSVFSLAPETPANGAAGLRGARTDHPTAPPSSEAYPHAQPDRTHYAPYPPPPTGYYRPAPPPAPPQHPGYAPYGHAPQPPQQSAWTAYHNQSSYPPYPPPPPPLPPQHVHHQVFAGTSPQYHMPVLPPQTSAVGHSQASPSLPIHTAANGFLYRPPGVSTGPPPPPPPGVYDWSSQLPPIRLHPPPGPVASSSNGGPPARHGEGPDAYNGHVAPPDWGFDQPGPNNSAFYGSSHSSAGADSSSSSKARERYGGQVLGAPDDQAQFQDGVQALSSMSRQATGAVGPSGSIEDKQLAGKDAATSPKGPQYVKPPPSDSEEEAPLEPGAKRKRKRRRRANEEPRDFAFRKFTCEVCKKMFARPSALATHERSHSKEKPHVCPFPTCGRPFAVPSNLRRHQRVYNHYDPNLPLPPDAPGARSNELQATAASGSHSVGQRSSESSSTSTSTIGVQTMPLPVNSASAEQVQHHPPPDAFSSTQAASYPAVSQQ